MDFNDWLQQHIFSASDLEAYLLCPYRFYAQSYLKLKSSRENDVELTPPEIGQLVHRILECFLSKKNTSSHHLLEEEMSLLRRDRPHLSPVLLRLQRQRIERMLRSFEEDLEKEQTESRALKPRFFEWSFGEGNISPLVLSDEEGKPVPFRGRIDRIDVDPEQKQFMVIDYKTGSTKVTGSQILSGESFQLPIYLLAVQKLLLPDYEPIGAIYYQLSDMSKKDGLLHSDRLPTFLDIHPRSSSLIPTGRWNSIFNDLTSRIGAIVSKIRRSVETDFSSHEEPCEPYCPYQDICRIRSHTL